MTSPEMELLFPEEKPCAVRYRPVRLYHPVAGFSYGLAGEWLDENKKKVGSLLLPDISCDYIFVSRLATKCTMEQLNPEQLLKLFNQTYI